MRQDLTPYKVKFLILILVPTVLVISYFYFQSVQSYNQHIKKYEINTANILLDNDKFVKEVMTSEPIILFDDSNEISDHFLVPKHPQGVENLLINMALGRLDCSGIGIYSYSRNEIVFHIGEKDVFNNIEPESIKIQLEQSNEANFTKFNSSYMYVIPISDGFIYSFQENLENKPNSELFYGMLVMAVIFAILGANLVEIKTKKRIQSLKQELQELKDNGKPLSDINDDHFNEIVQSVNDLREHLSSQQELLHTILDSLPLGIIYYDENGKVIYVNKTTTQITGYTKDEIMSFTLQNNILSSENVFWATLRSGEKFLGFESYCPTKDGREIPVMTSTKPLYDNSSNVIGIISSIVDISEQERLRKIEQRAKVMLDHISDGVMMVDNEGVINGFNRGAEEMTGLKAGQVLGKKYDDIFIKRKTIFTKLTQTLETKMEYTNYKKETTTEDGRKVYLMITTKILWDEQGKQIGAMGIYKDITHLEELAQQVQRADKLAVVGELAAGTAHEIRNPLTTIKGFIQFLKDDIQDHNKQQYVNLILKEINRINEIIREMLLLAKPAYPSKSSVHLNHVIGDIVVFMNSEAMLYNVQIQTVLFEELPIIELDERQIKQVFINIIRNAIQSMKSGGHITIYSSYNKELDLVEVIFEDQGEGIPEERIAKIYEPFFTTKEEGTGLGIPVSYRIMKNHGGDLRINSTLGKGTKVTLQFSLLTDDSSEDRK